MCVICAGAPTGSSATEAPRPRVDGERRAAGLALLARYPSFDLHAHPGRFFMRAARVTAAFFATVADLPVLGQTGQGLGAVRAFAPGEALADHWRQIGAVEAVFETQDVKPGRSAADVTAAHGVGGLAGFLSVEGGDFIEDRLDRIADAAARGVRSITIIHYRTNQIGDTQTQAATHGGLTPLGRETIQAMEAAE